MTRLTVSLDDDLYDLAKAVARAHDCSLSAAVNRLLRQVVERSYQGPDPADDGAPVVRCRERFTSADVDRLEAQDEER